MRSCGTLPGRHRRRTVRSRHRHLSSTPFRRVDGIGRVAAQGGCSMLASLRAGFVAALVFLVPLSALGADKPFKNDELADAAVKLEAQIKEDAGAVAKPVATLRREADAAFAKNDFRGGMQILAQIVAVAPQEAANWIRL